MSRIAYVNGRYVPHREAAVHIEDRGYQFADGVYEVTAVRGGRLVDEERHRKRRDRSRGELKIAPPMSHAALKFVCREVIRRNGVRDGIVYLQVTRGVAPRDHPFPKDATPSIVVTSRRTKGAPQKNVEEGIGVISVPDQRWARCDIKSISLLPNILGKQQAREAGAYEAWQIDRDGNVTEGTSTNAWIVTGKGEVVTRRADGTILNGVTRLAILDIIAAQGMTFVERPFSLAEAREAREAFLTSTTSFVLPVVRIDGKPVGDGTPGKFAKTLRTAYAEKIEQ
jgi:D-alanine transaminase